MRISDWSSDVCSSDLHVSAIALDLIAKRILEAVHFLARRAIDLVFDGRDGIGFGRVRAGHRFLGKIDLRDVAAQERHPLDLDKNISAVRKDVLRADRKSTRLNSSH